MGHNKLFGSVCNIRHLGEFALRLTKVRAMGLAICMKFAKSTHCVYWGFNLLGTELAGKTYFNHIEKVT